MSTTPLDKDFANIFFKPIAQYLSNPDTAEVMVNAHNDIWVEDNQGLRRVPESFTPEALEAAVQSLAQYVGRPLIDNVFSIDARMPDGSRVCIVLPPVSGKDPIFSIRLFKGVITDLSYLVTKGTLTDEIVDLISALVRIKKNIMVAGGTSSGKTTLLNLIAATIPNEDRILTIEDSRELQLKQEHVLSLEAKPADKYGKGEFTIRQCLKSSLRLRPDRIVVGEIRGGEAFDLIQAMNTGHGGCMGTVHANNPTETLRRIESIALTADVDVPLLALRSMITSALNVIISPARLIDGSRKIIQISEIGPLNEKGDYQTFDIIRYTSVNYEREKNKLTGYFEFTGYVPSFFDMFRAEGVKIEKDFFRKRISGDVPEELADDLLKKGYEVKGKKILAEKIQAPVIKEIEKPIIEAPVIKKEEKPVIEAPIIKKEKPIEEPIIEAPAAIVPLIPIIEEEKNFNFEEPIQEKIEESFEEEQEVINSIPQEETIQETITETPSFGDWRAFQEETGTQQQEDQKIEQVIEEPQEERPELLTRLRQITKNLEMQTQNNKENNVFFEEEPQKLLVEDEDAKEVLQEFQTFQEKSGFEETEELLVKDEDAKEVLKEFQAFQEKSSFEEPEELLVKDDDAKEVLREFQAFQEKQPEKQEVITSSQSQAKSIADLIKKMKENKS